MGAKNLAAALHSMSTAATPNWTSSAGIALFVVTTMISSGALAEQSQQAPTSDHQQLCKDLYNIYDTNMDEYYNKKNSAKIPPGFLRGERNRALSDFRRQGCKTKDIK